MNREQYKSGYWGIALCIYFAAFYGRTHADIHIYKQMCQQWLSEQQCPFILHLIAISFDLDLYQKYFFFKHINLLINS